MTAPVLDEIIVVEAKGIMKEKFPKMLEYFLEDSLMYVKQLADAFNANDVEGLVSPAHTLKSSARQMGAIKLSEIAKNIESSAREIVQGKGNLGSLKECLSALEAALSETHEAYKAYQS